MSYKNNKRIIKNTLYLTIRMIFVLGVSLYTTRIFLSVLGVEDFGIYNVVGSFVTMFAFLNNAMTTGIQRFYNIELGKHGVMGANKVYITSIYSQFVLAFVILILAETVGLWYMYNKMVIADVRFEAALWIFQFSVMSLLINIMSVPFSGAIMAHEKMDFYALVSIVDVLLKLGVAIILPYVPTDKLVTYGVLMLIISVANFAMYAIYARVKFEEIRFTLVFHKTLFKNLLSFSGWNIFGKIAIMFKEQGLNMLLNFFFGPVVNAARGVAFQVNNALAGFVSNINIAVKPQLTQSYAQGEKQRTFSLMFSISKLCYLILLVLAIPICTEINYILHIWLGGNVPDYTGIFVVIVIATTFINNLNAPVSYVVHAIGKMKKYQIITTTIELCILPVAYVILKMGAEPWVVFLVAFFFVSIGQIASLFILKELERFSIRQYVKEVALPLFFITICSIIIPYLFTCGFSECFGRLIVVFVISTLTIIVLSYIFAMNKTEKDMINKIIFKK